MAESWAAERPKLTPLPEVLPEPFDDVGVRMVGIDCLVAFEGRQYSVPFAHIGERVEVRGCARTVQILKDWRLLAVHQRHTPARLLIDPAHYDGTSTPRVMAPPPLGRMGAKIMELASAPVARRSIESVRHWRRSPGDGGSAEARYRHHAPVPLCGIMDLTCPRRPLSIQAGTGEWPLSAEQANVQSIRRNIAPDS